MAQFIFCFCSSLLVSFVGIWIGYVWGCVDGREEIAKLHEPALAELDELRRMNRAEIEASKRGQR
jgi:predicted DNA-binding transcriptional regulator